jgi:hypothetical protein
VSGILRTGEPVDVDATLRDLNEQEKVARYELGLALGPEGELRSGSFWWRGGVEPLGGKERNLMPCASSSITESCTESWRRELKVAGCWLCHPFYTPRPQCPL